MKNIILAGVSAIALAGAAVSAASAYTMSCSEQNYVHQTTDRNVRGETRTITYRITDRGWYTPMVTGWAKRGVQLQRTDSLTGTTVAYGVPNDHKHFIRGVHGDRTYMTGDGSRSITFSNDYTTVTDRSIDGIDKAKDFYGSCTKTQDPMYKTWFGGDK